MKPALDDNIMLEIFCTKNFENPTILTKVTVKNVGVTFFDSQCIWKLPLDRRSDEEVTVCLSHVCLSVCLSVRTLASAILNRSSPNFAQMFSATN